MIANYSASQADSLSVIIRFHAGASLELLREALRSIELQNHKNLELVLCLQDCADLHEAINAAINEIWQGTPPQTIIIDKQAAAGEDLRSAMLNAGIKNSTGRFISFLDYDDILFPEFHSKLISRLVQSPSAVAVCGTVCSYGRWESGTWHETRSDKFFEHGKGKLDLLESNFIPLHSYVVDTSKFDRAQWQTSENLSRFEDYLLLLNLAAQCDFDFYYHSQVLCQYRIRDDGSNSTLQGREQVSTAERDEWAQAFKYIQEQKKALVFHINASELDEILKARQRSEQECQALKKVNADQEEELVLLRRALQRKSVVAVSKILAVASNLRTALKKQ